MNSLDVVEGLRAYTVGVASKQTTGRTWLWYSIVRVALFAALMTVIVLLGAVPWFAAVLAAVLSLCISVIFLGRPRSTLARDLDARVRGERPASVEPSDDQLEDAALDAAAASAAQKPEDRP